MRKFLYFLILMPSVLLADPSQVLPINKFGGIDSDGSPLTIYPKTPDSQNVITDYHGGVQPRNGFVQFSTEPSHGLWQFSQSNGSRWMITASTVVSGSTATLKATTGNSFTIVIATISSLVNTYATSLGDKFYFVNTVDGLKGWDGSSVFFTSASLTADKITTFAGRVALGNVTGNSRVLYLSKLYDGTAYVPSAIPTDDDATQITVSGLQDENIEALYPFQNILMIFKGSSFQGLYGSRRSNFSLRVFSNVVGISGQESIQDCDGHLRWLTKGRKIYEFDGATFGKISEGVDNLLNTMGQGDTASRSLTQTSEGDWEAGTVSSNLSTTINSGSIVMSTMAVIVSSDNTESNFEAGTISNLDTTSQPGSLKLGINSGVTLLDAGSTGSTAQSMLNPGSGACAGNYTQYYTLVYDSTITAVTVSLSRDSSYAGQVTLTIEGFYSVNLNPTTTQTDITYNIPFPVFLKAGVTHRIDLNATSVSSIGSAAYVYYETSGSPYSLQVSSNSLGSSCPNNNPVFSSTRQYKIKIKGTSFKSTGNIISRTFDIGFTTNSWMWNWGSFTSTGTVPVNSTVTYETQTSSSPTGTFTSWAPVPYSGASTATIQEFFRYRATFNTTDLGVSPILGNISQISGPFNRLNGNATSQLLILGNKISSWGPLVISDKQQGGNIIYQFGSTNTASISAISNWQTITNSQFPSVPVNAYAAVRSSFTATSGLPLSLDAFQLNWTEGSTVKLASLYTNQRYWLSVSIASTSNNTVLLYDRAQQWQKYSGINADAMTTYNSLPYFGNSTGIYQADVGTTDNGLPISSYYQTATMVPAGIDLWSSFNKLYVKAENSDATLSTTYRLNGQPLDYSLGSSQMNKTTGFQNLKFPFPISQANQGKDMSLKLAVTGSSFWRLSNLNVYYIPGLEPD